jgi:acyl-[acyl-carrier-protein]-phospholipid O-acyltransferase/long-chain-fatty-acid--[acyl-carrier-protein] ligase
MESVSSARPASPARFGAYLYTQYFSAFNDNVHQMTVSLYLAAASGSHEGEAGKWQSLVQASFVLPFILFSALAGSLADRYNKRSVLIAAKWLEVVPMSVSFLSTFLPTPLGYWGLILGVFLMEVRSAFFSPGKYGILPEIVGPDKLVRANGILQMLTMVAIVTGEAVGGLSIRHFKYDMHWTIGLCLGISILGSLLAAWIPTGRPGNVQQKIRVDPVSPILGTLQEMRRQRVLLITTLTLSGFWLVSAIFRMNIPLFGKNSIGIGPDQTSYLWAIISIGIGAGAAIVSLIRGADESMGVVLPGALGVAAASMATSVFGRDFWSSAILLGGLGVFAGFYLVPQTALFQERSPEDRRGAYLGVQNFANNVFMLIAAGIYFVLTGPLSCSSRSIFMIAGSAFLVLGLVQTKLMPELLLGGLRTLLSRKGAQAG